MMSGGRSREGGAKKLKNAPREREVQKEGRQCAIRDAMSGEERGEPPVAYYERVTRVQYKRAAVGLNG